MLDEDERESLSGSRDAPEPPADPQSPESGQDDAAVEALDGDARDPSAGGGQREENGATMTQNAVPDAQDREESRDEVASATGEREITPGDPQDSRRES